jgi:hypothetical protein
VPKARYVFYRATFIPSATAGPTLDKVTIPSSTSVEVADKWSTVPGGAFVLNAAQGFDIDTSEYVYGSRSMHCTVPGVGPYAMYSAPIQVRAGRSYILTGLMKSLGNSGAQFRLVDITGLTISNPDGTAIASIIDPVTMQQALSGDADWFTTDQRDVNRYATPIWVAPNDTTVFVMLRSTRRVPSAGGTASSWRSPRSPRRGVRVRSVRSSSTPVACRLTAMTAASCATGARLAVSVTSSMVGPTG